MLEAMTLARHLAPRNPIVSDNATFHAMDPCAAEAEARGALPHTLHAFRNALLRGRQFCWPCDVLDAWNIQ